MPFVSGSDFETKSEGRTFYNLSALLSFLGIIVGKLKVAIEPPEGAPVTETREFSFVKDVTLRKILERDYMEIQRAYVAHNWKSVIILAGGAIEAILLDLLRQDEPRTKAAKSAPPEPDLTRWDLNNLINVTVDLGLVSIGVERLSSPVREYRNLIHPGNEVRTKLTFGAEEAKIALEVLHIVHRDLSNKGPLP